MKKSQKPIRIRFTTLLRDYGPVRHSKDLSDTEWAKAVADRRFMTVYHPENDFTTPVMGIVNRHGCVNTLCKLVFGKPLPKEILEVMGMRNNEEAFRICNRQPIDVEQTENVRLAKERD